MSSFRSSTRLLISGYIVLMVLFSTLWMLDSQLFKEQHQHIVTTNKAVEKIYLIAQIIQTIRDRVKLSHEMIASDDIFEKDRINQNIQIKGQQFWSFREQLITFKLTEKHQQILHDQSDVYPQVVQLLEQVFDLTLLETKQANHQARSIIIEQIVPQQNFVTQGFMQILSDTQEQVKNLTLSAQKKELQYNDSRLLLIIGIIIGSFAVLIITIKRINSIELKLTTITHTDALTQIPNRRKFDEQLQIEWRNAIRTKQPLSLLLIDIDFFKKYNDHYGHQMGDSCLTSVAQSIYSTISREVDLVARYGGEEFAAILPATNAEGAQHIAEQTLANIHQLNIQHEASQVCHHVTVSIGIACTNPQLNQSEKSLVQDADVALYQAKKQGRSKVVLHQNG